MLSAVVLLATLGGLVGSGHVALAQPWTALAPAGPPLAQYYNWWQAVAISDDGTKLVAGGGAEDDRCQTCQSPGLREGALYVSTNGGASWISGPIDLWQAVAASADWTQMVAVSQQLIYWGDRPFVFGSGQIYTSTNSGVTWTAHTNFAPNVWSSVASSVDGSRLVALAGLSGSGFIYVSTDSGSSWTKTTAPHNDWTSVASSADGSRLIAAADTNSVGDGLIYLSSDGGASWAPANVPVNNWASVASSADGTQLVAAEGWWVPPYGPGGGAIYRSADSGASWTLTAAPLDQGWQTVASSGEGTVLLAGGGGGFNYIARDSGSTWTLTAAPPFYGGLVALSPDGSRAIAGGGWSLCAFPYPGAWHAADLSTKSWFALASSADGSRVVAAAGYSSQVSQSTNWGATWTVSSTNFSGPLASSAEGTKLFAAAGPIYASSDSGASWSPTLATNGSGAIASSADGSIILAASNYGLYLSTNGGAAWSQPNSTNVANNQFAGVASSADGMKLVAAAAGPPAYLGGYGGDGYIYTSSDSGRTWNWADAPQNGWTCVASSADGVKLVAGSSVYTDSTSGDGYLYTSANSGAIWKRTRALSNGWSSVACSADGIRLVAVTYVGDAIYLSSDSGTTWVSANAPAGNWAAITCSADGAAIVAVGNELICTLRLATPTQPALSIGRSSAGLGLSWLVPSAEFVLQQNSDLASTNWVDLPVTPTLNFTNLNFELPLPRARSRAFYRLKQQ